jgi:hypothetical protein
LSVSLVCPPTLGEGAAHRHNFRRRSQRRALVAVVNQRSAQRNNKAIPRNSRAMDRGIQNHHIASHQNH